MARSRLLLLFAAAVFHVCVALAASWILLVFLGWLLIMTEREKFLRLVPSRFEIFDLFEAFSKAPFSKSPPLEGFRLLKDVREGYQ